MWMPTELDRLKRATAERTKARKSTRAATADELEAFLRKNWAAAWALYNEDPDAHWPLKYVVATPEPSADLVERARNRELSLPSDVIVFGQALIWDMLQQSQVRIEPPRRDDTG